MPDGDIKTTELLSSVEDWLEMVKPLAQKVRLNERYVYFDGHIFAAKHGPVKFTGLYRSHDLPDLPHLSDSMIEETLANPDYWRKS